MISVAPGCKEQIRIAGIFVNRHSSSVKLEIATVVDGDY
jgi:hypothetical protein